MTITEMKKRKKELGYSYVQISELSGVPLGTVQKIFCGATKAPRYETLQALSRVFAESAPDMQRNPSDAERSGFDHTGCTDALNISFLREPQAEYICADIPAGNLPFKKRQGEYTIDDYYALPEERRVELINGVFYDVAAPTGIHQAISMYISTAFFNFIRESKGSCRVFAAPLDVQLNKDNKTMVQPDILVISHENADIGKHIYGAPDLVIEILSDSTRGRDLVLKLNKYCEAGVREYWTVDPEHTEVTVFPFEKETPAMTYSRCAKVPVGIWNGRCSIDLADLFEYAGVTQK